MTGAEARDDSGSLRHGGHVNTPYFLAAQAWLHCWEKGWAYPPPPGGSPLVPSYQGLVRGDSRARGTSWHCYRPSGVVVLEVVELSVDRRSSALALCSGTNLHEMRWNQRRLLRLNGLGDCLQLLLHAPSAWSTGQS